MPERKRRVLAAVPGAALSFVFYLLMWMLSQAHPHRIRSRAMLERVKKATVPADERGSTAIVDLLILFVATILALLAVAGLAHVWTTYIST